MTPLVETHSADEVERAADLGARLDRRERPRPLDASSSTATCSAASPTASRPAPSGSPSRRCSTPADVAHYRAAGADVVLVGEALVTGDDPVADAQRVPGGRRHDGLRDAARPVLRRVRRALHARVAHRRDRRARRPRTRRRRPTPRSRPSSPSCTAPTPGRPSIITEVPRFAEHAGRRARHPQARGPQPHRLAQDQQRARPGAAHQAHRQDARDRRDRRRPARRRDGHRGRAVRPRVHDLHGRGRHRAPGAQRRPHAPARRRGRRR